MVNETCPNAFADAHNSKSKHMRSNILTHMFVLSRWVWPGIRTELMYAFISSGGPDPNRRHDQTWQRKGKIFFFLLLAMDDILTNTFDPNIESSLASYFGNSKKRRKYSVPTRKQCSQTYAAIRHRGGKSKHDFTTVGNSCWSCCEMILNWMKSEFYEWNENDNAYSFNLCCISCILLSWLLQFRIDISSVPASHWRSTLLLLPLHFFCWFARDWIRFVNRARNTP